MRRDENDLEVGEGVEEADPEFGSIKVAQLVDDKVLHPEVAGSGARRLVRLRELRDPSGR